MRRSPTAPFLSAAALAGVLLVTVAPAASADPAAEVGPGSVSPGGSVTVSVSCDPLDGIAPESIDATSRAFDEGAVTLTKVPGDDAAAAGPAYRGTARIPSADGLDVSPEAVGPDSAWTVDGTCPAPPGGQGRPWSATFDVTHGGAAQPCAEVPARPAQPVQPAQPGRSYDTPRDPAYDTPRDPAHDTSHDAPRDVSCAPATVEHGVRAGEGGAFTGSVPALVAGGLLIAGAVAAAVHRLRRRSPAADA
ncbi:hypothetical protein OG562_35540 [Streptomyces sp. NBC_01275]|uniref:hypothetical protein n=1 Tax=Streptomyces sp. NBC_01275 TaxID=2903807 RepID=UPI00225BFAD1|nr:hypothetical protein [Streptomyces sp. NBC_01275]MCX4766201.1 hypothetical protein [Streptomyces sp. NBC_01275]